MTLIFRTAAALLFAICLNAQRASAAEASAPGCTLVEKEGKVEIVRKGASAWVAAQVNDVLHVGDQIRTGERSRATLRWSELSVVRVNELSNMEIRPPGKPTDKPKMELRSGASYFFSREKPSEVEFRTPAVSGAIRGTEFNLAVEADGRTVLSLLDGAVDLANEQGTATMKSGEQAVIAPGTAPKTSALLEANNVIQWVLYYPAVAAPGEFGLSDDEQKALGNSLTAYRNGDLLGALASWPESRTPASDSERGFHAALLLSVGRVDQCESELKNLAHPTPVANALHELISAVKHQLLNSLPEPATASEWMARSYYLQSRGRLDDALPAARKALAKAPDFGAAHARVAELEFSFGHADAAMASLDRALELSPGNAEALTLKGFLAAAKNRPAEALSWFDKAIAADGALANAWLGRGLVKGQMTGRHAPFIRNDFEKAALDDLQVAATLEPQRAVLRSYLGKGFSDGHDVRHARKELDLAKTLDPNDPTSWLYSALLNDQVNRVNEAIEDLEHSKDLNENRNLFRSSLLLDQDDAVRSANLAAIYRDEGMTDYSAQEAARAVNSDYANYSAHLFLANSYDALRDPKGINIRYETPWFGELLLANLLAPVNGGSLSQSVSQQEYSKLFAGDGFGVFSSTAYSSHGDWLQSGSQYGVFGDTSYSVDASYRTEQGFRPNNDLEQLNLAARVKQQITPKDTVFLQMGYSRSEFGDLNQYYDQNMGSKSERVIETQEPTLLAGYHHEWEPGSHTLALFGWFNDRLGVSDTNYLPLTLATSIVEFPPGTFTTNQFAAPLLPPGALQYRSILEAYSGELQHIWENHVNTLIVGGRFQAGSVETTTSIDRPPPNPLFVGISVPQHVDSNLDRLALYAYDQWQVLDELKLIGGISYDRLHYPRNVDTTPVSGDEATTDHFSPKGGILWTPLKTTHVRAAYSQSLGGVFFDQSVRLEPVQLAGFGQAFRSLVPESVAGLVPGTRFETWGLGVDHEIEKTHTYFLVQGEILNSHATRTVGILTNDVLGAAPFTPNMPSSTGQSLGYEEKSLLVSVSQLVGKRWTFGGRYKLTDADLNAEATDISSGVPGFSTLGLAPHQSATLNQLWLYGLYQCPCGFFGQFDTVWSGQSNRGYTPDQPGDDFWQYNVYLGHRFLQRRAEVRLGLLNLSNRDYKLNPLTLYNELPRQRTLTVSLKLNF